MRTLWNVFIVLGLAASGCAQEISIQTPPPPRVVGPILRPFHVERRVVSPAKLTNTPRLESLIRAGNLYLSAQDVIALALENNVDIAIQRYGPYLAREVVRRAQGGGALRDIGQPISPGTNQREPGGSQRERGGLQESSSGVGSGGGIVIQYRHPTSESGPGTVASTRTFSIPPPRKATSLSVSVPSLLSDTRHSVGAILPIVLDWHLRPAYLRQHAE